MGTGIGIGIGMDNNTDNCSSDCISHTCRDYIRTRTDSNLPNKDNGIPAGNTVADIRRNRGGNTLALRPE